METIKINEITKKDSGLVIVNYDEIFNLPTRPPALGMELTLNTKWQSQEVNYLENDVGIGGTVSVEIVVKGQYINIAKVDMNSAKKGVLSEMIKNAEKMDVETAAHEMRMMSPKDIMIVSQCLTKAYYKNNKAMDPKEVLDAYNFFVKSLEDGY